ncbi:hypothetical protein DPMN_012131 [Dreissena polymorpha]|uniref:Uncharacterized protein n=1 Tax=Dreissena polymorpha TaxID=45954 RepID=A0A9D4S110_DREPO|nr:hypothetical protein DPMN_012131 [Dreissena polymorpha]
MSRECRVSTFERDTRHSRDILSTHDKSVDSRHTTFSRRSIRRATNQSTVKIDRRLICRASRERRENVVCRPVWE